MPTFTLSRRHALVAVACAIGASCSSRRGCSAALSLAGSRARRSAALAAPAATCPDAAEGRSSTSTVRSAARALPAAARARGSPTRSRGPAARRDRPTRRSSTSRRRSRTASRCSCRASRGQWRAASRRRRQPPAAPGRSELRHRRAARRACPASARSRRRRSSTTAASTARSPRSTSSTRSRASGRPGSTTCEGSWCRDLDARPSPHARGALSASALPSRTSTRVHVLGLVCSLVAAACRRRLETAGWPARLCRVAALRARLVVGERPPRRPRPQSAQRRDRSRRPGGRRRDGTTHPSPLRHPRPGSSPALRRHPDPTSASSSSSRSAARRRRARSSRCSPSFGGRAASTMDSTNARGCAATACTSSSRSTSGS